VPVLGGLRQPNGLDHVLVWLFALAALADICSRRMSSEDGRVTEGSSATLLTILSRASSSSPETSSRVRVRARVAPGSTRTRVRTRRPPREACRAARCAAAAVEPEDPNECTELADTSGDTVPVVRMLTGTLPTQDECRGVRPNSTKSSSARRPAERHDSRSQPGIAPRL